MKKEVDGMGNFSEEDGIGDFINWWLRKWGSDEVKGEMMGGKRKLVYVGGECLRKEENVDFVREVKIWFYGVDEGDWIWEWGDELGGEYGGIGGRDNRVGGGVG